MPWNREKPSDASNVRDADNELRTNWEAIKDAMNREHFFPGSSTPPNFGLHRPSRTGIVYVGTAAQCMALSAGAGVEASGAMCFDTEAEQIRIWNGSSWAAQDLLIASGDTITGTWTDSGSCIDGRSPAADGRKLDTMAVSGNNISLAQGLVADGSELIAATVLPGYTKAQCYLFVFHQSGRYNFDKSYKRIECSAGTNSEETGWTVSSKVRYGTTGTGTLASVSADYVMIGVK